MIALIAHQRCTLYCQKNTRTEKQHGYFYLTLLGEHTKLNPAYTIPDKFFDTGEIQIWISEAPSDIGSGI